MTGPSAVARYDPSDFLDACDGVEVFRPVPTLQRLADEAGSEGASRAGALCCEAISPREIGSRYLDHDELERLRVRATWRTGAGERAEMLTLVELADRSAADPRGFEPPHSVEPAYEESGMSPPLAFEAVAHTAGWRHGARRLSLPRPLRHEARVFLWDYRGASAALLDDSPSRFSPSVSSGTYLARIALGTRIPGLRQRRDAALERLTGSRPGGGREAATLGAAHVAGTVTEYLHSRKALSDGRAPPLGYVDDRWIDGQAVIDAPRPGWMIDARAAGSDSRRARLSGAAVKGLEEDAFGHGIHSPRGRHRQVPAGEAPETEIAPELTDPVLGGLVAGEEAAATHELTAHVRRRFDPSEQLLLDARLAAPGSSLPELAAANSWQIEDVQPVWRRIIYKASRLNA